MSVSFFLRFLLSSLVLAVFFMIGEQPSGRDLSSSTWSFVPSAEACGECRRVSREARRARDRVRAELRRAERRAQQEIKRAAARVQEETLRVAMNTLDQQAAATIASLAGSIPFLPVSQIVSLSLSALEYERNIEEMRSWQVPDVEIQLAEANLQRVLSTLRSLEELPVHTLGAARLGFEPLAPRASVQSATLARVRYEELTRHMASLVLDTLLYQTSNEQPTRRPVTLMYLIWQALVDYAHLKADISLISSSQREHADLYQHLIQSGGAENISVLLQNALHALETMPVRSEFGTFSLSTQASDLIARIQAYERRANAVIQGHYEFPLLSLPSSLIRGIDELLRDITYHPGNTEIAWLVSRPQEEIDLVNDARHQLERVRDRLVHLDIPTPRDLVSRFLLDAVLLIPRYEQALTDLENGIPTALGEEILEVHEHLSRARIRASELGVVLDSQMDQWVRDTLRNLMNAYYELSGRMAALAVPAPELPSIPPLEEETVEQVPSAQAQRFSDQLNQAVAQLQNEAPARQSELERVLEENDPAEVTRIIDHDSDLPRRTQQVARAVQQVNRNRSLVSGVRTVPEALSYHESLNRLHHRTGAFTDSDALGVHAQAIESLYVAGLVGGYPDGSFKPQQALNRAEMLFLAVEAAFGREFSVFQASGGYQGASSCFPDVPDGSWFEDAVCFGFSQGIINGYPDGTYRPEKPVNFVEGLRLSIAAFRLPVVPGGEQWFSNDLDYARTNGLIPQDYSAPDAPLKRGQMASMLSRALILKAQEQGASELRSLEVNPENMISIWNNRIPLKAQKLPLSAQPSVPSDAGESEAVRPVPSAPPRVPQASPRVVPKPGVPGASSPSSHDQKIIDQFLKAQERLKQKREELRRQQEAEEE